MLHSGLFGAPRGVDEEELPREVDDALHGGGDPPLCLNNSNNDYE